MVGRDAAGRHLQARRELGQPGWRGVDRPGLEALVSAGRDGDADGEHRRAKQQLAALAGGGRAPSHLLAVPVTKESVAPLAAVAATQMLFADSLGAIGKMLLF